MQSFAEFLGDNKINEAHFLPFYRLGSGKYKAVGLKYDFENCIPNINDSIKCFIKIFENKKINTVLVP